MVGEGQVLFEVAGDGEDGGAVGLAEVFFDGGFCSWL